MGKESVDVMIAGGKATAAPPLGPALGPLGVNIKAVVDEINKKTASFNGMQVPVKVTVDSETKEFEISIGTPPASALIKKECGIQKGASNPKLEKVADLKIEQVMKIAQMKEDALLGKTLKEKVKEIAGSCQSLGVMIEGKPAHESIDDINKGVYDAKISSGKTELTAEELKALEEEKKHLQEELKLKQEEYEKLGNKILGEMKNKSNKAIRDKMTEAGIPMTVVDKLAPKEEKK